MTNEPDDLDRFIDEGLDRLSRGELRPPPKPRSKTGANGSGQEKKAGSQPGFRMTAKGLMWSDPSDNEKPEIVISGSFEVVAECRDDAGSSWGRLLRWKDSDGRAHEWAMPISLLAGDGLDVRRALLDGGLYVSASGKARSLLILLSQKVAGHLKQTGAPVAEQWRRQEAKGDMIIVRYADDMVLGFEHEAEARRFWDAMRERLEKFALSLHPDKTRLIEFGRYAAGNRARKGLGKPETFNFLGFTFICGKEQNGKVRPQAKYP